MHHIPTNDLRISDVPSVEATWPSIEEFALTFRGYEWAGSFEECAELANSTRKIYDHSPERRLPKLTLDELRACLHFEQRRSHHSDCEPDMEYVKALLDAIRRGVASRR